MRVMCTGRVDLAFMLRGLAKGADGLFIGGCHLNECNYTTHGNFYALRMSRLCQKLVERLGINPGRVSIKFISGGEGNRFAEIMNAFSSTIHGLGPLGRGEGLDGEELAFNLEAAAKLVPYIKLLERERFRVHFETEQEFDDYFNSEEFNALFEETIGAKLETSRIVTLLGGGPRSTGEIADTLGMLPSEVSRQLKASSQQGLVRFDRKSKRYALG